MTLNQRVAGSIPARRKQRAGRPARLCSSGRRAHLPSVCVRKCVRGGSPSQPIPGADDAQKPRRVAPGTVWDGVARPRLRLLSSGSLVRSLTSTNPSVRKRGAEAVWYGRRRPGIARRGESGEVRSPERNGGERAGERPLGRWAIVCQQRRDRCCHSPTTPNRTFPHGRGCRGRAVAGNYLIRFTAPVAQLDRASGFEPAGRPFESGRARLEASVFGRVE